MPDVDALFKQLINNTSLAYVATKLKHETSARVQRWQKLGIPGAHLPAVIKMLRIEGCL